MIALTFVICMQQFPGTDGYWGEKACEQTHYTTEQECKKHLATVYYLNGKKAEAGCWIAGKLTPPKPRKKLEREAE